jgi:ComF family protein
MSLKNLLLDLLFPKKCYGCGRDNIWLCSKCLAKLKPYQGEIPRALKNNQDLIIAGEYKDKLLNDLIVAFKFGFNKELAIPLFIFLKTVLDKKILIDNLTAKSWVNILIIPIPLHKQRHKWRGFNQSELLAREISNYYGWPISLSLIKIKKTDIQAELKEEARLNNQKDSFRWTGAGIDQTILLIDDVITSGATINEAELVLQSAGAKRVIKVALAKG